MFCAKLHFRGFTLVELLVVIAIVSILAAVLFPVFARAKAAAKKSSSLSNLKQIDIAWLMYVDEYDGTCMRISTQDSMKTYYFWGSFDGTTLRESEGLLYPYTRSKGIQCDPSFDNRLRAAIGFTGYGYNYAYLSPSDYSPPTYSETPRPVQYGAISDVSQTVGFASCARINNWSFVTPVLEGNTYLEPPSNAFPSFHGRHNGAGVIAWADGHAKAVQPQYRRGNFGWGFSSTDFVAASLGDIDSDGDMSTDELFDLQ